MLEEQEAATRCLSFGKQRAGIVTTLGGGQRHLLRCSVVEQQVEGGQCNRVNKLIRKAGSVLRVELEPLAEVLERRKLLSIMDNTTTCNKNKKKNVI